MLEFTRFDFNNIINYYDIRSSEISVVVNSDIIDSNAYTKNFRSNTDIVPDLVSPSMLSEIISGEDSFLVKIRKHYPFHEAFIDDSVRLSYEKKYCYTPILYGGKEFNLDLGDVTKKSEPSSYIRVYDGELLKSYGKELVELKTNSIIGKGKNLFVVYSPNEKLQKEILVRVFRKKIEINEHLEGARVFSLRDRDEFNQSISNYIQKNHLSESDSGIFYQTLLQLWPCGARGRLSSYIHMSMNRKDIVAEMVTWNTRLEDGNVLDIDGNKIDTSSKVSRTISERGIKRSYRIPRSSETDKLVVSGILRYRDEDEWAYSGWPLLVSKIDPNVSVRSNGRSIWMKHSHGGLESIESLLDGSNKAVGTASLYSKYLNKLSGRKMAFLGLGLGVLQRSLAYKNDILTVENNEAVIDLFRRMYPEFIDKLHIIMGDFFKYIESNRFDFDVIVIDFYDPTNKFIHALPSMVGSLNPGGMIFLNKQGGTESYRGLLERTCSSLNLSFEAEDLMHSQSIFKIRFSS